MAVAVAVAVARGAATPAGLVLFAVGAVGLAIAAPFIAAAMAALALAVYWIAVIAGVIAGYALVKQILDVTAVIAEVVIGTQAEREAVIAFERHCEDIRMLNARRVYVECERIDLSKDAQPVK